MSLYTIELEFACIACVSLKERLGESMTGTFFPPQVSFARSPAAIVITRASRRAAAVVNATVSLARHASVLIDFASHRTQMVPSFSALNLCEMAVIERWGSFRDGIKYLSTLF